MQISLRILAFSVFVIASSATALVSGSAHADQATTETPVFSVDASMLDNLKSLSRKRVTVYLIGGTTLTGSIKAVGNNAVHLEKLDGKDYFDALVSIDKITAIDTRARTSGR